MCILDGKLSMGAKQVFQRSGVICTCGLSGSLCYGVDCVPNMRASSTRAIHLRPVRT